MSAVMSAVTWLAKWSEKWAMNVTKWFLGNGLYLSEWRGRSTETAEGQKDHLWLQLPASTASAPMTSSVTSPAFVLFSSQAGVVTFDPLRLPGHRVAPNLQLHVRCRCLQPKVICCKKHKNKLYSAKSQEEKVIRCNNKFLSFSLCVSPWNFILFLHWHLFSLFSYPFMDRPLWSTHSFTHSFSNVCNHLWFPRWQAQRTRQQPLCFSLVLERWWSGNQTSDLKQKNFRANFLK